MTWWAWAILAACVGTLAWGASQVVLVSLYLRRTSRMREDYRRRVLLRRWMRFHGGLK